MDWIVKNLHRAEITRPFEVSSFAAVQRRQDDLQSQIGRRERVEQGSVPDVVPDVNVRLKVSLRDFLDCSSVAGVLARWPMTLMSSWSATSDSLSVSLMKLVSFISTFTTDDEELSRAMDGGGCG